ncbi:hypothetical protein BUE80_DR002274 [Diplocarpon rosae]|nr:hypothetical protein BUE80_DR002274 [Diplocarpon rosae]
MAPSSSHQSSTLKPAIIQSRDSSTNSQTSSSCYCTDHFHLSSKTATANRVIEERKRVPDNAYHYVTTMSRDSKVFIHNQLKGIYDPGAPLTAEATSKDYRRTYQEEKERRLREELQRA